MYYMFQVVLHIQRSAPCPIQTILRVEAGRLSKGT